MTQPHTPGPWRISHLIPDLVKDTEGNLIADCETTPHKLRPAPPKEQDIANARLIAAAPDLLAACHALMRAEAMQTEGKRDGATMGQISLAIDAARAAIAKATGA